MIATVIIFMSEFYFLITPVLCGCCEFWWWFITYFTAEGNSYDWWWKLFCDIIPHFYLISSFAIYDYFFQECKTKRKRSTDFCSYHHVTSLLHRTCNKSFWIFFHLQEKMTLAKLTISRNLQNLVPVSLY